MLRESLNKTETKPQSSSKTLSPLNQMKMFALFGCKAPHHAAGIPQCGAGLFVECIRIYPNFSRSICGSSESELQKYFLRVARILCLIRKRAGSSKCPPQVASDAKVWSEARRSGRLSAKKKQCYRIARRVQLSCN